MCFDPPSYWDSGGHGVWQMSHRGQLLSFRLFPICRIGTVCLPSNVSMGFVFCFFICYHFVLYLDFGFCSVFESYITFKISNLFVLAALDLRCWTQAFSVCGEWQLLERVVVPGLLSLWQSVGS